MITKENYTKYYPMFISDGTDFRQNDFFQKNPSMRHPQYWNAFQLIQSYKLRYIPSAPARDFSWWILVLFSVDIAVTVGGAILLQRGQTHPRSSKVS